MDEPRNVTILLIEDDDAVRDLYLKILELKGYVVVEAIDGNDALEKFNLYGGKVDLIITDVMMPKMNGKKLYDEIKLLKNDIRAIFTSGYHSELIKSLKEDGYNYLQKPFSPQLLLEKITDVMETEP